MTQTRPGQRRPRVAISMGDPAGVGPELCAQLLVDPNVRQVCVPIIFGDRDVLAAAASRGGHSLPESIISVMNAKDLAHVDQAAVFQIDGVDRNRLVPGQISSNTGEASYRFIQLAISAALAGHIDAVSTGPINKGAWKLAGIDFPGHTELFAERFGTDRFCMMMTSPAFSCSLVTTHVGYRDVPQQLNTARILEVIELTWDALRRIRQPQPRLVVLGLNPHAGEGGLFGDREEERLIQPAIEQAAARGISVEGPLPPDTAFLPAIRARTDGYVCMYHDQGLIPFKAFNFDTGVNITLGLPMVRTSVDHGTALDIAWQGIADVSSFVAAVTLAAQLSDKNTTADVDATATG